MKRKTNNSTRRRVSKTPAVLWRRERDLRLISNSKTDGISTVRFYWRRERDLNPWIHSCITRFRIVRVRPLRHLCKRFYCIRFYEKRQVILQGFSNFLCRNFSVILRLRPPRISAGRAVVGAGRTEETNSERVLKALFSHLPEILFSNAKNFAILFLVRKRIRGIL